MTNPMKVLLFSNDLMPFGELPTSGGGLRCWQLYKGLQAHGYEVLASMPSFTYLTEKHYSDIPEEQRSLLWDWATQDEILRRVKPDAVMFASNWDHYGLSKDPDVPLIIDLHGSRLIETTMFNAPVDTERKLQILSKADCLLTAGQRQRLYFYGWLLQAGRVSEEEHFIRYIPVSLGPEQMPHEYPAVGDPKAPRIVSGGGWFPWQNQSKTIFAACKAVDSRGRGSVDIFGTPHDSPTPSAEELEIRRVYAAVQELAQNSDRIAVNGYVSRNELLGIYSRASVALEAMEYNLERELAFTTRTVEYLWCGLPVLYNNFGELSEHISEYDAGWCVDPCSELEINRALEEIFDSPETIARKGANAQKLVSDRFTWDKTIEPLVQFLRTPKKAVKVQPAYGAICSNASFLSPRGTVIDIPVSGDRNLKQEFIFPAENLSEIEVPYSLSAEGSKNDFAAVEIVVTTQSGRKLSSVKVSAEDLRLIGTISIKMPLLRRPSGGDRGILNFRILGVKKDVATVPVHLRGLLEEKYPFVSEKGSAPLPGKTLLGQEVEAGCIALSFMPGTGRVYRLKHQLGRALEMVKQGDWVRLGRVIRRRLPAIPGMLRRAMQ